MRGDRLRRSIDLAVSGLGLLLLSPLFLAIAACVRFDSPGSVLYRARRVGRHGHPFVLYKFRSMVVDADRLGPGITQAGDPRITQVGAALRRMKLDELPQLVNVLKGDMGLVGPRPEDPRYVAHYNPEQRAVLDARPGMTSKASLAFRDEASLLDGARREEVYVNEVMPRKLAIELEYLANRSLARDLGVLVQTVLLVWMPTRRRRQSE